MIRNKYYLKKKFKTLVFKKELKNVSFIYQKLENN